MKLPETVQRWTTFIWIKNKPKFVKKGFQPLRKPWYSWLHQCQTTEGHRWKCIFLLYSIAGGQSCSCCKGHKKQSILEFHLIERRTYIRMKDLRILALAHFIAASCWRTWGYHRLQTPWTTPLTRIILSSLASKALIRSHWQFDSPRCIQTLPPQ